MPPRQEEHFQTCQALNSDLSNKWQIWRLPKVWPWRGLIWSISEVIYNMHFDSFVRLQSFLTITFGRAIIRRIRGKWFFADQATCHKVSLTKYYGTYIVYEKWTIHESTPSVSTVNVSIDCLLTCSMEPTMGHDFFSPPRQADQSVPRSSGQIGFCLD